MILSNSKTPGMFHCLLSVSYFLVSLQVWQVPENGLVTSMSEPVVVLEGHSKRVGIITWHPTARNILLSAGKSSGCVLTSTTCCFLKLAEDQFEQKS